MSLVPKVHLVSNNKNIVIRDTEVEQIVRHFRCKFKIRGVKKLNRRLREMYSGITRKHVQLVINEDDRQKNSGTTRRHVQLVINKDNRQKEQESKYDERERIRTSGAMDTGQYERVRAVLQKQDGDLAPHQRQYARKLIKKWGLTLKKIVCPMKEEVCLHLVSNGKIVIKDTEVMEIIRHFRHKLVDCGPTYLLRYLRGMYVGINKNHMPAAFSEETGELKIHTVFSLKELDHSEG